MKRVHVLSFVVGAVFAIALPAIASAWTLDAVKTEPEFDLSQKTLVPYKYELLKPSDVTKKWHICLFAATHRQSVHGIGALRRHSRSLRNGDQA